jgi:HK97 family phage portal protein
MGIFGNLAGLFRRGPAGEAQAQAAPQVRALTSDGYTFYGLDDPAFKEMIRGGDGRSTQAGITVSTRAAMRNTTVFRCVSLVSGAVGMLPLHLHRKADKSKADDHPLFRVLHRRPNAWQTAYEFRNLMQQRALTEGDAFALIVRSGTRILQLVPLDPDRVKVVQRPDWSLEYHYDRGGAGTQILPQRDVFHLRDGMSLDGVRGMSRVRQAAEAIALAMQAETASARLFRNGAMVGGVWKHPGQMSPDAYDRLKASIEERRGAENAHRDVITEEGMEYAPAASSGRESQAIEQRKHQIEEIARPFGVPRPLLGVDDTSWGSGIDVLGQLFVRYALNPWFEAWQQAIERDLLTDAEADVYEAKFNPGGLLRGNMKDQAEFFAKALGSGGHQPWMHEEEVREISDMPPRDDLPKASGQQKGTADEPPQAA